MDVVAGDEDWFFQEAQRAGVRIVHVIDTHVHADRYSGGPDSSIPTPRLAPTGRRPQRRLVLRWRGEPMPFSPVPGCESSGVWRGALRQ